MKESTQYDTEVRQHSHTDKDFNKYRKYAIIEQVNHSKKLICFYCYVELNVGAIHPSYNTVAIFKIKPKP